jgi:hypothetical protein
VVFTVIDLSPTGAANDANDVKSRSFRFRWWRREGAVEVHAVASGGTVSGSVLVKAGGTVAPGSSTAILNRGSVTFVSGSNFEVEVNGNVAGTSYDPLNVTERSSWEARRST